MITHTSPGIEDERDKHRKKQLAPISERNAKSMIARCESLKPGDYVWVTAEGMNLPAKFVKFDHVSRIVSVEYATSPGEHKMWYYQVLRKATKKEIVEITNSVKKLLKFFELDSTEKHSSPTGSGNITVVVTGHDDWSGPEVVEEKRFHTIKEASAYCKMVNSKNNLPTAPSYYETARVK